MQTSRSPKSSSSDDDELLLDTVELGVKKKHFLDYDYPQMSSNGDSHIEAPVSNGKNNLTSNSSSINTASNQLESKRKIDRPCTSKMASDQQLSNNSNNVESVYSILSMFGGQNNSSDIASKFLELSKNREMCTGKVYIYFFKTFLKISINSSSTIGMYFTAGADHSFGSEQ